MKENKKAGEGLSIRMRVILIIVITNLLIILISVFSGTRIVSRNIKEAQEMDMQVVADIADRYISTEIELLHFKALDAVKFLSTVGEDGWHDVLTKIFDTYPEFIGAAIFDGERGRVVATGAKPAPHDAMTTTHIAGAFEGKQKLSTTYFYGGTIYDSRDDQKNPNASPDDIVFYVAVPFPYSTERLLAVTVPGMFFHNILSEFQIWETGHVFMVDTEGNIISNPRPHWVYQRVNLQRIATVDTGFNKLAQTSAAMARGEEGIAYYTVYGVPRVAAFKRVSGSQDGWSLGAVAPLPESPFRTINMGLMFAGTMGFFLGILAAIIGSVFIRKPFEMAEKLKAQAEQTSQYKSQFLANMSHEMRTPLTSVIGLTELTLRTVRLDKETHGNLLKVYRSGETLLGLINDILDISKIEAGRLTLNPIEYDLPSLLNDTITQSILYVGEKPVKLVLDISEDLPRRLFGDELRVKQVLNNLLSNAFKFTKEGTVELYVRCENDNDGESVWMTARVSDTGAGIKPQDFDKLFTLYAKMEESLKLQDSSRRTEGTGLGLSICKRVVEMMDGTVDVSSEYGKGSVFTVRMRQKHVDDSVIGADVVESLKKFHYSIDKFHNEEKSRINLSYARVLVVDDNKANLDVAKGLMSLYGMKIDCVTSGLAAIDLIREENVKYSAIFMDHMMPEIDGIEATRLIREIDTDYAKNIPIIALTANAIIGNEEMFLSKGFQAFVTKPIDLTRLDTVLRQWVRDKDAEALLSDKTIQAKELHAPEMRIFTRDIEGVDMNRGIARFASDEQIFCEVLASFARNTRPLLDDIKNVNTDNLNNYTVTVHGIKGSARGIFATDVGNDAEALEMAGKRGDLNFIHANNQKFIDDVYHLIDDIETVLAQSGANQKPTKDKPDNEVLAELLAACENHDIDEIDTAMSKIENFTYAADDGLAEWLRVNVDQGKIKAVKEKLQTMNIRRA